MHILWLDDPGCHDPQLVGGKAAQLARLAAGFDVPYGFCVPAPTLAHLDAATPFRHHSRLRLPPPIRRSRLAQASPTRRLPCAPRPSTRIAPSCHSLGCTRPCCMSLALLP